MIAPLIDPSFIFSFRDWAGHVAHCQPLRETERQTACLYMSAQPLPMITRLWQRLALALAFLAFESYC